MLPENARVFETYCASIPDLKLWISQCIVAVPKNLLQRDDLFGQVQWEIVVVAVVVMEITCKMPFSNVNSYS